MFDSIIAILDYVLQGLLVCFVAWYLLNEFKRVRRWMRKIWRLVWRYKNDLMKFAPGTTLGLIALCVAYCLGVIANSISYDVLQPAHQRVILATIQDANGKPSKEIDSVPFAGAVFSIFTRQSSKDERAARTKSLCAEVAWTNQNNKVIETVLDRLLKQLRIYRGVLIASLAFALSSLIKILLRMRAGRRWFSSSWWSPWMGFVIGSVLFLMFMRQWLDTEAEYHLSVRFGLQTVGKQSKTSSDTNNSLWDVCVGNDSGEFGSENKSREHKVLLVSDLHFDPFLDSAGMPFDGTGTCLSPLAKELTEKPPAEWASALMRWSRRNVVGAYQRDTNYELLRSSLQEMHDRAPDARLIVVSGDLLVHRFSDKFKKCVSQDGDFANFAGNTMQFLAKQFRETFPHAQVLLALGNNDTLGHYTIDPKSRFLRTIKESWLDMMQANGGAVNLDVFDEGGYYSARVGVQPNVTAIVTNTTVWSCRFNYEKNDGCSSDSVAGVKELAWLRRALQEASAAKQHVWIIGHIPPGIDVYSTANDNNPTSMYQGRFTTNLVNMLTDFGSIIDVGVFGHIHSNEFRLLDPGRQNVPLQLVPSISPSNGNNPSFLVLTVDQNFLPMNYAAYFLDLDDPTAWRKEYDFQETYNRPRFSGNDLFELSKDIPLNTSTRESYQSYFMSCKNHNTVMNKEWRRYWCSLTNLSPESYKQCLLAHSKRWAQFAKTDKTRCPK